jgi:cation transport regulator ChaB
MAYRQQNFLSNNVRDGLCDSIRNVQENVFISMINYYQVIVNDGDTNRHRR